MRFNSSSRNELARSPKERSKSRPRLSTPICKPCWELKYCPYGPMVEHFPLDPEHHSVDAIKARYQEILADFAAGRFKTEEEILDGIDMLEYHWPQRWQYVKNYRSSELQCNVFGHVCPVFFTWEAVTETKTGRRHSRYVPTDMMLKVVRRDNGICQICSKPVPDNEVEFDHLIPYTRGGPTSVENLRLVHRACNRKKRDSLSLLLRQS